MIETQPKRRLFRFSLRTLFAFITAVCVAVGGPIAWYQVQRSEYDRQFLVAQQLRQFGVHVKWEPTLPNWLKWIDRGDVCQRITSVYWEWFSGKLSRKLWASGLIPQLTDVQTVYGPYDPADPNVMSQLGQLKYLTKAEFDVGDPGILKQIQQALPGVDVDLNWQQGVRN